jgi:hypothetical protein
MTIQKTLLGLLALGLAAPVASAAVPMQIPLQGALRDNAGAPVSTGTFEMTFTLYRDAEGTDEAWTTTRTVTVQGGLFRAMLGEETPVDPQLFGAEGGLWLGVTVEQEPELPLRPLASTPYALAAGEAAGLNCSGCVSPEALSAEASSALTDAAVSASMAAVEAAGYDAAQGTSYDGAASSLEATTVQSAIDELKGLIDNQTSASNINEGAGSIRGYEHQWGLPSYGVAKDYVHIMHPTPPKVLLHLYGGENTGFASSNNLIVSNTYTPNTYSGGANGVEGDDTMTVSNAGAFNQGDHILIHQSVGPTAGQWELNAVQAINGNSLKLAKALIHEYVTDASNSSGMSRAQVVIAASYNTFEVVNGGVVRPSTGLPNGTSSTYSGGIVYIRARQLTVKNGGTIHADEYGYQSNHNVGWNTWSPAGQSECGTHEINGQSNNCSGGGGGYANSNYCSTGSNHGSGGGGNQTAGQTGYNNGGGQSGGTGGAAKGTGDGSVLHFGGAGGEIVDYNGGTGGGLVVLGADTVIVEDGGRISADGGSGTDAGCRAGTGGGAGGTVAIFATNADLGGDVRTFGGSGYNHSHASANGGDGGEGWVLELDPIPGVVNQSYATGVEIWIDGQDVTAAVGDPNDKGIPHWNAETQRWGATGTEPWSSGPLDLTNVAAWTPGEHTIEFKETGGAGGDLKGYIYLIQRFSESTPPVNDTCKTPVALDISEGPIVIGGTTEDIMGKTLATDASNEATCGGASGPDVVYQLTLTERSLINAVITAPFNARLYLRAADCDEGESVYCGANEIQTTPLEPGDYFLFIDSDAASQKGDFTLAVSTTAALLPEYDTCDTAVELLFSNAGIATHTGSTLYSLDQYSAFCGGDGGPDVVYAFTAGTGEAVDITVTSDEFEPVLHVYKGACAVPDNLLTCSDTGQVQISAGLGGDYWMVVDSPGEAQWGTYDLTVSKTQ